tara:strand:+ start:122 stop:748 length:627 start_codon:yes stop_codon:yes gene_type:complete
MELRKYELGPIGTNAFAIIQDYNAIVVDAPADSAKIIFSDLEKDKVGVSDLLFTHGHWDHMADGADFVEKGVTTYGHRADTILFNDPMIQSSFMLPGLDLKPVQIHNWLEQGQEINLLGFEIEVRHVPGHCPGNIMFYIAQEKIAFVGDALFSGGIGRYDLPGGDLEILERSIQEQIYTLPGETKVFAGHGPETNVEKEKNTNPFVRA